LEQRALNACSAELESSNHISLELRVIRTLSLPPLAHLALEAVFFSCGSATNIPGGVGTGENNVNSNLLALDPPLSPALVSPLILCSSLSTLIQLSRQLVTMRPFPPELPAQIGPCLQRAGQILWILHRHSEWLSCLLRLPPIQSGVSYCCY